MSYTIAEVAKSLAMNELLGAGFAEIAAQVFATPDDEVIDFIGGLPGHIADVGHAGRILAYTERGVRIFDTYGLAFVVEVFVGDVWYPAARVSTERVPLGAAVAIVEAVLISQAR